MKATLEAINQMQADGVIGKYAIGGAVGATFYLAPAATIDLDVFVELPTAHSGLLVSLSPIYEYLKSHGGKVQDEYIVVGGWPSSFSRVTTTWSRKRSGMPFPQQSKAFRPG